jgi:hypothetical protein
MGVQTGLSDEEKTDAEHDQAKTESCNRFHGG